MLRNKLWSILLIVCTILSSESQASFLSNLKNAVNEAQSRLQETNIQSQQVEQQQQEFKEPEFRSLDEKEKWIQDQSVIYDRQLNLYYNNLTILGKNMVVNVDDTKESINQKYANAENLYKAYCSNSNMIGKQVSELDDKSSVLNLPRPVILKYEDGSVLSKFQGNIKMLPKSIKDKRKLYFIGDSNDEKENTLIYSFPYDVFRDYASIEEYKKYLNNAYRELENAKQRRVQLVEKMVKDLSSSYDNAYQSDSNSNAPAK